MRVLSMDQSLLHEIPYLSAAAGGQVVRRTLQVTRLIVDSLPPGIDALLATADLQGVAGEDPNTQEPLLLGERLAEELALLGEMEEVPPAHRTGVLLAGDLFTSLDKMGADGDCTRVWRAFARSFRWVCGIVGNHDTLPGPPEESAGLSFRGHTYLLDGNVVELDGLRIAGAGGVIGNPRRAHRRDEAEYCRLVSQLQRNRPDLLLLHEAPEVPEFGLIGNHALRHSLNPPSPLLVVCAHVHWSVPLVSLSPSLRVLNVAERAVILQTGTH